MADFAAPLVVKRPPLGAPTTAAVLALFAALIALKAAQLSGAHGAPIDFECFHFVGTLVRDGLATEAYSSATLRNALQTAGWNEGFMPWTYPPQFQLIVSALAVPPLPVAYVLFVGGSLAGFLWVLRRVAGERFGEALLLAGPVIAVNIAAGQNGLLTGALAGAAALGVAQSRRQGGWAIGALIIKPHLAIGLGVSTLAGRRWEAAVAAAGVVLASAVTATLCLGPAVWSAFLGGVREAGAFLQEGLYPLHRMASAYAVLRAFGLMGGAALAVQAALALTALAAVARLSAGADRRTAAGFALLAGGLVSPYLYDYDLTLFVLGLVMLTPELERRLGRREFVAVKTVAVLATLYGFVAQGALQSLALASAPGLSGAMVLLVVVLSWRGLRRPAGA